MLQGRKFGRKALTGLTLASALLGSVAFAAETPAPAPAADAPETFSANDALGLKDNALGIKFYGWVEQSYTYNFDSPSDKVNVGRVFDAKDNTYRLNQVAVNFEKALKDGKDFDWGGKVELMYGSDGALIHSAGLSDGGDSGLHQTYQFDPTQFYGLFRAPIGNGVTVKFGKYVTPFGAEVIDAPGNALYSRSFLFGFAIPFTHTGVQFDYAINDNVSVYYGLVQGWDVFNDTNGTLSHMAGIYGNAMDKKLTYFVNFVTGPERANENTDYRSVIDVVLTYTLTDQLSATINGDFGNESGTQVEGATGDNWYGVAGYLTYTINDQIAATLRAEYMADETGTRLAASSSGTVTEVTLGLDIHPLRKFMNLRLRPEVRWDHSYADHVFNGPGPDHLKKDQFTVGADLIITF